MKKWKSSFYYFFIFTLFYSLFHFSNQIIYSQNQTWVFFNDWLFTFIFQFALANEFTGQVTKDKKLLKEKA